MENYNVFVSAIHEKRIVSIRMNSKEKGVIERTCIPFDFGPSKRNLKVNPDRYHFYDLNSPKGSHNLSITPNQLLEIKKLEKTFSPSDYITWETNWFISRDWGMYS